MKAGRTQPGAPRRRFVLNMDFAFGAQADTVMRALILTFESRIRSISVVGKSAGLLGKRGDILLPNKTIFCKGVLGVDTLDEIRETGNADMSFTRVRELAGKKTEVYEGPIVTIPGSVLQGTMLLNYYERIHGCIGVEMEASYYARQVEESVALGMLSSDVKTRFIYFVGDLPRSGRAELITTTMEPHEGIPTMYSITRATIEAILLDGAPHAE